MGISANLFLFLWFGLPVVLLIGFVFFLIKKILYKRAIKRGDVVSRAKVKAVNVFFVIVTVLFGISFSLSLALFIFLSMAAANM